MTSQSCEGTGKRWIPGALVLGLLIAGAIATAPDADRKAAMELQLQALRSTADSGSALLQQGLDDWNSRSAARHMLRRQALEQAVARLGRRRDSLAAGLLPDAPSRYLLQAIRSDVRQLSLYDLQHLDPVVPLPGDSIAGVRKQRLSLTVDGHFPALLHYLEEIQALPWALRVEVLELTVTEHPVARMQLIVVALRRMEDWGDA